MENLKGLVTILFDLKKDVCNIKIVKLTVNNINNDLRNLEIMCNKDLEIELHKEYSKEDSRKKEYLNNRYFMNSMDILEDKEFKVYENKILNEDPYIEYFKYIDDVIKSKNLKIDNIGVLNISFNRDLFLQINKYYEYNFHVFELP